MTTVVDPNYARLDERVTGLEKSVNSIATSISDISKKLDERSRPQWTLMASAAGILITLIGVVGAAWKAPIDSIVARQEQDLRYIEQTIVPRVEIDGQRAQADRERDDMKGRIERLEGWYFEGRTE